MIEDFIAKYGKRLYGLCLVLCADTFDADDLYQETWLKVYRKFDRYDKKLPFEPYLTEICVNIYRDLLRKRKRSPVFDRFKSDEEKDAAMENAATDSGESIDCSALHDAIAKLPEKMRLSVILHFFHDLDIKRTAAALHIPEGTVKSRLHQAKKLLRKELSDETDLQF